MPTAPHADGAADPNGRTTILALGLGVAVEVRGDRADEVHEALAASWSLCPADPGTEVVATVTAVLDSDPAVAAAAHAAGHASRPRLDDLLQLITREVTVAAIDAVAGRHLLLHAACLADPATGLATAFVAEGGTGKTTLARVGGPGRWYVTDETVAVREDGTVVPYPKPLSVRRSPDGDHKDEVSPVDLGLVAPPVPVRLSAVYLLDRRRPPDAVTGGPVVTPLATLDGIEALVPHTSHLTDLERPLHRLATLLEGLGGARRVTYTEAADLAPLLGGGGDGEPQRTEGTP
jgi:hypothetical protein